MSERYGPCLRCVGHGCVLQDGYRIECGRCGGTGFSGSIGDYPNPVRRTKVIEPGIRKRNMDYIVKILEWKVK